MYGCKKTKTRLGNPEGNSCEMLCLLTPSSTVRRLSHSLKMAEPKRKRKVLALNDRVKIIKAVEDNPSISKTQLAIEFNVPLPTLSNIVRDKDKYLNF